MTSYDKFCLDIEVEKLAAEVHNLWIWWAKTLMRSEKLSQKRIQRWKKECFVPYSRLSEKMKEADRKFARKFIKVMKGAT